MAVDERTFAADIAGTVTALLDLRPDLPFGRASVEDHVGDSSRRHDFRLYGRNSSVPVLTGEIKMPDSPHGKHPLNSELVDDALDKASRAGVRYCFTWNVKQFVLFDCHIPGVPFAKRHIEGPTNVLDVGASDEVRHDWARTEIKRFWEQFLERFADLVAGRRRFDLAPLDLRFVSWLEAALEGSIDHTFDALEKRVSADLEFKSQLNAWMLAQGWEHSRDKQHLRRNLERAARLASYMLLTRMVFYQVLKRRFPRMSALTLKGIETSAQLKEFFETRFVEAVQYSRDYETVFVPDRSDVGNEIPFIALEAPNDWSELVERIDEFDFSQLDFDVIGRLYERLIDPIERRRFGQFYTSPDVVDLINSFCIRDSDDTVLDPACGGGTFLVRAYSHKKALAVINEVQTPTHEKLLGEVLGIDVGAFPAQLSTINLAVRNLSDEPNYPRVAKADFFNAQLDLPLYNIPLTGGQNQRIALGEVDAVVGNPPYIRQEAIGKSQKTKCARLFQQEWPTDSKLSGRSDLYAYFFGHAGRLLKPGGYLGFVTSIAWLDTTYGFKVQEFLLRNFKILAIVESEVEKWFEDARVATAVTIIQRESDSAKRMGNNVRFIRLRKPLAGVYAELLDRPLSDDDTDRFNDLVAVRDYIENIDSSESTDYWRVAVISQRELWTGGGATSQDIQSQNQRSDDYIGGKWGQYMRAPESWFALQAAAGHRLAPLGDLADIKRGFTSGADKFYCVRDVTQRRLESVPHSGRFQDRWGFSRADTDRIRIVQDGVGVDHPIEKRFIEPELHSLSEVNRTVVKSGDVSKCVINAPLPRSRLSGTHLEAYITHAEQEGWHTGTTVESRSRSRPWYDLGIPAKHERGVMFWPMAQQYRHVVPLNADQLVANHNLFNLWPKSGVDSELLWAVLNSSITVLSKHQFGRSAGIEGNLKTEVVDARMMLVPDIRDADHDAAARAIDACKQLSRRDTSQFFYEEFEMEDRRNLDDAILELIGVVDAPDRNSLQRAIYDDIELFQRSIRKRELIAQRDRRKSGGRSSVTPQALAGELWEENSGELRLLEFPRDFIELPSRGGFPLQLPPGDVEIGTAMVSIGGLLRSGQIRVGGRQGAIFEMGTIARARFAQALAMCGRAGKFQLPSDEICEEAVKEWEDYKMKLANNCQFLAGSKTLNESRQKSVGDILLKRALRWTRTS